MATKEDRRPYNGVCRVWIHSMRFVNPFTMCCRRSLLETVLLRFQFQAVWSPQQPLWQQIEASTNVSKCSWDIWIASSACWSSRVFGRHGDESRQHRRCRLHSESWHYAALLCTLCHIRPARFLPRSLLMHGERPGDHFSCHTERAHGAIQSNLLEYTHQFHNGRQDHWTFYHTTVSKTVETVVSGSPFHQLTSNNHSICRHGTDFPALSVCWARRHCNMRTNER